MTTYDKMSPAHAEWTRKMIARADYFTACMFLGSGRFDTRRAATLEEARELRAAIEAEHAGNYGRGAMIYAVVAGGAVTVHVE